MPSLPVTSIWCSGGGEADVAKLKRLGLTISHSPGYELSPRGHAYLERRR